jgi:L-arabinose isomerase
MLHDGPVCWQELEDWLRTAVVARRLAHNRLEIMVHYYGGMLDVATDLVHVSGGFDLDIDVLEVDELTLRCSYLGMLLEG